MGVRVRGADPPEALDYPYAEFVVRLAVVPACLESTQRRCPSGNRVSTSETVSPAQGRRGLLQCVARSDLDPQRSTEDRGALGGPPKRARVRDVEPFARERGGERSYLSPPCFVRTMSAWP